MTPLTPRHSCPTTPSYPIIVRADQWQNPLATTASMPWGTDRRVRMSSLTRCRVCSPMLHPLARQQRSPREVVNSAYVYDEGRHGLPRRTLVTSARPRPARWHAPSIAKPRPLRRPLRPKHPFSGASGRGGLHVEHNTDNPPHHPVPIGGFCDHRTSVTACRRRVAPLWSQFPPDNKSKRGNSARAAYHPTHQRQRSRLRPAQRAPQRPDCGNHVP